MKHHQGKISIGKDLFLGFEDHFKRNISPTLQSILKPSTSLMKPVHFYPFFTPLYPSPYSFYTIPHMQYPLGPDPSPFDWQRGLYPIPCFKASSDIIEPQNSSPSLKTEETMPLRPKFTSSPKNLQNGQDVHTPRPKEKVFSSCSSMEVIENRNILPNMTSNVLSYMRRINRSGRIVQRIIAGMEKDSGSHYTAKKFYSYQFYLKENITDFKGKDAIEVLINCLNPNCSCFSLEEQVFYNKVCRALIFYYLNQEIFSDILSSNRVSSRNRRDYLKMKRYIQGLLRGTPTAPEQFPCN